MRPVVSITLLSGSHSGMQEGNREGENGEAWLLGFKGSRSHPFSWCPRGHICSSFLYRIILVILAHIDLASSSLTFLVEDKYGEIGGCSCCALWWQVPSLETTKNSPPFWFNPLGALGFAKEGLCGSDIWGMQLPQQVSNHITKTLWYIPSHDDSSCGIQQC